MPDIRKTCAVTGQPFVITQWEQEILERIGVPIPTICAQQRLRRRLSHRNERNIYKNKCNLCKKNIISIYSPEKPYTIYCQQCWWSDKWDPKSYGMDFDFEKPFFEQFQQLQQKTPRIALLNTKAENSEYCNITTSNKNCYLVFGGDFNEDCMFCGFNFHCRNVYDCYWIHESELCYECIDCLRCYNVTYSQNTNSCRDSAFLFECRLCADCVCCVGLQNKQYCIFNEKYSKEDYLKKLEELKLNTISGAEEMKKQFTQFKNKFPKRASHLINCENCKGDRMINCKNCVDSFDITECEDVKDIFLGLGLKDCLSCDHVGHGHPQLFYEMLGSIEGFNCAFCLFSWTSPNTFYCDFVLNSHDLFGCTNIKRSQYCILNKQYTKEQYDFLRAKIIEHMTKTKEWGEFFPIENSLFGYNETIAQEYFPLTKEQTLKNGYKWKDDDNRQFQKQTYEVPNAIENAPDSIINEVLECTDCSKNFKAVPEELRIYKQMHIPIPRKCHECRHHDRLVLRPELKLYERTCDKCSTPIATSLSQDRAQIVYCEKCYLGTIV